MENGGNDLGVRINKGGVQNKRVREDEYEVFHAHA
jgi:hypothetical protein